MLNDIELVKTHGLPGLHDEVSIAQAGVFRDVRVANIAAIQS
jgi:hypothetical protein